MPEDGGSSLAEPSSRARALSAAEAQAAVPLSEFNGGPLAHLQGAFGPLHAWPVMPIHTAVLPDGRVMAFGTDTQGGQGAELVYAVWDPKLGTAPDAFMTLPNTVGTDIFCGAQVLLPDSGQLLMVGGDGRVNGVRNYATADVNVFDATTNTMAKTPPMRNKRWYATAIGLRSGETLVLGGCIDMAFPGNPKAPPTVASYATLPEVRSPSGAWRTLGNASDKYAYGEIGNSWF